MHYTLKNSAGEVIDSSAGGQPLPYLQGANNIVVGLEKALVGASVGDKKDVEVSPAEGYGERVQRCALREGDLEEDEGLTRRRRRHRRGHLPCPAHRLARRVLASLLTASFRQSNQAGGRCSK